MRLIHSVSTPLRLFILGGWYIFVSLTCSPRWALFKMENKSWPAQQQQHNHDALHLAKKNVRPTRTRNDTRKKFFPGQGRVLSNLMKTSPKNATRYHVNMSFIRLVITPLRLGFHYDLFVNVEPFNHIDVLPWRKKKRGKVQVCVNSATTKP